MLDEYERDKQCGGSHAPRCSRVNGPPLPMTRLPSGFSVHVGNLGVKDDRDDFVVLYADHPVAAAGVFTQSRFAGPSVLTSRATLSNGAAQAVAIVARNANVANGTDGDADNQAVVDAVAALIGCSADDVIIASTGVIGRRYPVRRMVPAIAALQVADPADSLDRAAAAIMTTDTVPKLAQCAVASSRATVVGMAKGVGMIEPNMATLIAVLLTDADVDGEQLRRTFGDVVERTFNCVSVDTDTSTSDTAVVLASGAAGSVGEHAFAAALLDVATSLARQVAADGEGAETLIEVTVDGARDRQQAKRVAKSIVNSPLVKTAVHGADPNWGRVAMAIGKCDGPEDHDIDPRAVVIRFGDQEVYPLAVDGVALAALSDYLRAPEVRIHVTLGTGGATSTVWGCDLTAGYVRINADYTT